MAAEYSRRTFVVSAAAVLASRRLGAQVAADGSAVTGVTTSVAAAEKPRILAQAPLAVTATPRTLRDVSATVATLTAAYVLTQGAAYSNRAGEHLNTWLLAPATRLSPQPDQSVVDLVPLAELARATSFLVDSTALPAEGLDGVHAWMTALLEWMNTARAPVIERDTKDHRASAWLLLAAALARALGDEQRLDDCLHRFHKPTLRNQVNENGVFPQEVATPDPYRNTLFNFDLLAGACQLLSTPFDNVWDIELADGPGMRSVAAFLYPVLMDRGKWPYISDAEHFRELPGRRPALLFAGRAYSRPEYVSLWRSLPSAIPEDLAATFPIREPLLWTSRAAHGR